MQSVWLLIMTALLFGAHPLGVDEKEEFRVERREVTFSDGRTIDRVFRLYPEQNDKELAFDQPVGEKDTRTLRVHFRVEVDPVGSTWFLELLNRDQVSEWKSTDEDRRNGDFWSGEIVGDHANVLLHILGDARGVKVQIDKLAITGLESKPQSITTKRADIVPILDEPADIRKLGKSVARIRFIGDDGGRYFCTGFLVARDLLMTNEHCFSSSKEATSALVDFDFDAPAMKPKTVGVVEFLWNNFILDYALVRLSHVSGNRSGLTLAASSISLGEHLIIIQHPEGQFKQVSLLNCQVSNREFVQGRGNNRQEFSHLCNTVGGSSGSAVWDRSSGEVIGLHHFGFHKGAVAPSNQAVDMGAIMEDIFAHDPKVYWSLTIVNANHPKQ